MAVWHPFGSYEEKAKYIIHSNRYMVLATCTKDAKPWANPVLYAYDDDYNLYFLSAIDSKHGENCVENPDVAFAIFDTNQPIGSKEGVQGEGKASLVAKADLKKAIEAYSGRVFPNSTVAPTERYPPAEYSDPSEMRFFKIKVTQAYVTGPDRREPVDLAGE
ncbi:MAG: pyridoxamine 5'-phosphate oxidase family protein [Candidatus Micrarchaeota archaeon]|nr:pyridoxamine 5'-phosphate oxidase family protein [Candidatus Micrarchaeota archaeon]